MTYASAVDVHYYTESERQSITDWYLMTFRYRWTHRGGATGLTNIFVTNMMDGMKLLAHWERTDAAAWKYEYEP